MRDAIPLGRIAGFVVNVHWSVLVILWLFTWSLATMLPGTVGGYPAVVYVASRRRWRGHVAGVAVGS